MERFSRGEIVLTRDNFGDKLWEKVATTIQLLIEGDYQCKVTCAEPAMGIVEIEYCYKSNVEWGGDYLEFLTDEEWEEIWSNRRYKREEDEDDNC